MSNENIALQRAIYAHEGLTLTEKAVALCLVWHRNNLTGKCNPSQATVAREIGASPRAVRYALASLAEKGVIASKRTRSSSVFWFLNGLSAPVAHLTGTSCLSQPKTHSQGKSPFREELRTLEQAKAYGQTSR